MSAKVVPLRRAPVSTLAGMYPREVPDGVYIVRSATSRRWPWCIRVVRDGQMRSFFVSDVELGWMKRALANVRETEL